MVATFVAAGLTDCSPLEFLSWSAEDFGIGCLATLPMFVMLAACYRIPSEDLNAIRVFLRDTVGPLLDRCRLVHLIFLALLAGVCEELAFRGFLYFWIRPSSMFLAIVVSNLLFGIVHAVTPMYAVIAGLIGLYLTALLVVDKTPNLLIPMTAHALYDFAAFLVVVRDYRRNGVREFDDDPNTDDPNPDAPEPVADGDSGNALD